MFITNLKQIRIINNKVKMIFINIIFWQYRQRTISNRTMIQTIANTIFTSSMTFLTNFLFIWKKTLPTWTSVFNLTSIFFAAWTLVIKFQTSFTWRRAILTNIVITITISTFLTLTLVVNNFPSFKAFSWYNNSVFDHTLLNRMATRYAIHLINVFFRGKSFFTNAISEKTVMALWNFPSKSITG